jgi:hypothetical protein
MNVFSGGSDLTNLYRNGLKCNRFKTQLGSTFCHQQPFNVKLLPILRQSSRI